MELPESNNKNESGKVADFKWKTASDGHFRFDILMDIR
jgi:hypothetical protein